MTFTPVGIGQAAAFRAARYLWKHYICWTVDDFKPGQKIAIPYLKWTDEGARDAYRLICNQNHIPVEG